MGKYYNNNKNKKPIPVLILADKLCVHTLKVTQNLNNFPKKYRFTLVDKIVACSLNIYGNIVDANLNRGQKRIEYQTKAIGNCRKMKYYLKLTYEILKPECSITYWNGMIVEIEKQLTSWKESTTE